MLMSPLLLALDAAKNGMVERVVFSAEAEMACSNVVVSLHRLAMVVECCVNGNGLYVHWLATLLVCRLATAYACVGGDGLCMRCRATAFACIGCRRLLNVVSDGEGVGWRQLCVRRLAMAFVCVGW